MTRLTNWVKKNKEKDRELKERLKDAEFEKGDTLALIIAALITIVPVVLLILGLFSAIIWVIFLR